MEAIEEFRKRKDEFFKESPESPIPEGERSSFAGLKYFPESPGLRFQIALEKVPGGEVEFETSTGERKKYRKIGKLKFEVGGQNAELTLYQADLPAGKAGSGSSFLPFRDATSGKETYGAGRYLEVEEKNGEFEVDFNYAYNPYCAYSPDYSCPLPPAENWLKVSIRAGEKDYHE